VARIYKELEEKNGFENDKIDGCEIGEGGKRNAKYEEAVD
jgi:hypothetical protein